MVSEWWFDSAGTNLLRGVPDDEANPPMLEDWLIVKFLSTIPQARESFNRIVKNMLPLEQERLYYLASGLCSQLWVDPRDVEDNFQHRMNTSGIHTCGRTGGGLW